MEKIFFDNPQALLRTLIIGVLIYPILVFVLRVSGKRTLSKMNAFDFIVTVALGSTLATVIISKDVSLAQGVLALLLLVGLQFSITWSSMRIQWLRRMVTGEPSMLFYRGDYLEQTMTRCRVTEDEVRAAIRSQGIADLNVVEAVVLETDGTLSVVIQPTPHNHSALGDVQGPTDQQPAGQQPARAP